MFSIIHINMKKIEPPKNVDPKPMTKTPEPKLSDSKPKVTVLGNPLL